MRAPRPLAVLALCALWAACAPARAADPLAVELRPHATVGAPVVTLGDVALVTGGDAEARARAARLDLAELKVRQPTGTVARAAVDYRLRLAGTPARVTGAERVTVALALRPVTADEVLAAARAEVLRQQPGTAGAAVELAVPLAVKLPEVPAGERPRIAAKARAAPGPTGRVQVDVTIAAGDEHLLSHAVQLEVRGPGAVRPAGGPVPPGPAAPAGGLAAGEVLVRPGDAVEMRASGAGFVATDKGAALQAGRLGQAVLVQNARTKQTVTARVTGPRAVEIDLGGAP